VGILLHHVDSDLLERIRTVTLQTPDGESFAVELERAARMGKGYRVKFLGFEDRTAAERLRAAVLLVPRELFPPLPATESYLVDLVGATVVDPDGGHFGIVVAVQSYPSVDSVIIEKPDGTRVEQPLVGDWVELVRSENAQQTRLSLRSLEGLI
jgi:16S rRNA processing protein RimM